MAAALLCSLTSFAPLPVRAQPEGVVAVTAEPEHKIRFDNGRVRMYEVILPKGKTTLMHEHRQDNFAIFFANSRISNEPHGAKPVDIGVEAGIVGFASTARGPYSHKITGTADTPFHVIALELLSPMPTSRNSSQRTGAATKMLVENPRGRVFRITLTPGEATDVFTRPAATAVFAINTGRVSETPDGKDKRLWDFAPGHYRLTEVAERLTLRNEGAQSIDLVEIELF